MPDTKITNAAMTPKTTQSVCKHCRKSVAFRGNYWLQVETSGYLSDELCAVNPNGRHEAEPASTGEPPEEFDMHITPRSVTRAARPSKPSAPQTSAEPCFRGCTATKDRKLCADNSGLMITWCGCECHDSPEPAAPQPVSGEKSHFVPGPRFCAWCSAWQGDGENHSKFCDRPAQGTQKPPKVDMPQLIAQEILDYAFRPVNGVWKLNFTTMKAIIQKYWLRCYFPPASQKEEIQTAKNELLERFASVFDSVSMPDMAAEIRSEIVATPASTARTDGQFAKLFTAIQEAITCTKGVKDGACHVRIGRLADEYEKLFPDVCGKVCEKLAAPGSVPQAPMCKCPYAKDQSQEWHPVGSLGCTGVPQAEPPNLCPICRAEMYKLPATIHCPICEAAPVLAHPNIEVKEVFPDKAPDSYSVLLNGKEIVSFDNGHSAHSVTGNLRMALAGPQNGQGDALNDKPVIRLLTAWLGTHQTGPKKTWCFGDNTCKLCGDTSDLIEKLAAQPGDAPQKRRE